MLRYGGLPLDEITVFDEREPLSLWTEAANAIRQGGMRSESDGHFFPTDYPGFALLDAVRHRSLRPLLSSAVNRYHPSRQAIVSHGQRLGLHFGLPDRLCRRRIARLILEDEPVPHVSLLDEDGAVLERARHVLLAVGHGSLRWPRVLESTESRSALAGPVYHEYQPKEYDAGRWLVIGAGMGAANEWVNVVRAGGSVVSVRRRDRFLEQPLSAPRCCFSSPWLDRYQGMDRTARAAVLAELGVASYPRRASWTRDLSAARRAGRFTDAVGEVESLQTEADRIVVQIRGADGVRTETVDRVIAATGFRTSWVEHPLMRDLVASGGMEVDESIPVLADDCSIPGLTGEGFSVGVSGPLARWAFPAADSFAGMKYAGRRFSERVLGRGISGPDRLIAWTKMVRAQVG
jgi:hypothetical protein